MMAGDLLAAAGPMPRALLFAGFNDGRVSDDSNLNVERIAYDLNGKIGGGIFVR